MTDVKRIFIGSWFQRTTLHLSEIYDFLKDAESPLALDKKKLRSLRTKLNIVSVERVVAELEYVVVETKPGITVKIYEDGLITLSKDPEGNIQDDINQLTALYEKELSSALSYIFSLGAPIPKELANIKTVYPYFILFENAPESAVKKLLKDFDQEETFEIKKKSFSIYRGDMLYIINMKDVSLEHVEVLVGEQIFIREFKAQLHRYLNLHRIIWENIAEVKERGSIKGRDISEFKGKIEGYKKAINFIGTRIDQMGSYIGTRGAVLQNNKDFEKFTDVLQFKYETLSNTLSYVKDIWAMTSRYVDSALNLFAELESKATNNSIKNLTVVISMGVGATLIGLFTKTSIPSFTWVGVGYFFILALIGYTTNKLMSYYYIRKEYTVSDIKADRDIK